MRNFAYIIIGGALLLVVTFYMGQLSGADTLQAVTTVQATPAPIPDSAKQIGQWIEEEIHRFGSGSALMVQAEAMFKEGSEMKIKAESTAQGFRKSLCEKFRLNYEGNGTFTEAANCEAYRGF